MIDIEATIKEFGYNPDDLKPQSHKKVVAICDKCGKERLINFDSYRGLCLSCGHTGEKNGFYGKHHSEESVEKNRQSHLGNKHSEKTKKRMSEDRQLEKHSNWKGGNKVAVRRANSRRKEIFNPDPIELNKCFFRSEGHHIDKKHIINIPYDLHRGIFHRQTDGLGMKEINKEAFKYLYHHKEDLIIPEPEAFNINLQIFEVR